MNYNDRENLYGNQYFDFSVKKPSDFKIIGLRIGIIILALVLNIVFIAFLISKLPMVYFIFFLLTIILTWFLWKYTKIEFEYAFLGNDFEMLIIYGSRLRKLLFKTKITSLEHIAPYSEGVVNNSEVLFFCADPTHQEQMYYALFKNTDNKRCAVVFNAPKKALSVLKYYNSSVFNEK